MTDTYNNALAEEMRKNVWDSLKAEAKNMSKLEYATVAADIAGIFDPTPTSDAIGFVLSVAQRDAVGALLSLGSMVPYLGDGVAKPLKIAKVAPKTAKALEAMLRAGDNLAKAGKDALKATGLKLEQVAAARKKALERVQQAMLDAKKKIPGCESCVKEALENRRLHMPQDDPARGAWKGGGGQPVSGNGVFEFKEPKTLPNGHAVHGIEYRNGAPNFDPYVNGPKYDLWEVTGNAGKDGKELARMMRENNPNWVPPSKDDYVLHHFEDGKVGYVPRVIHDVVDGGVAHTGGNSMTNNKLF